jgi:protein gp37
VTDATWNPVTGCTKVSPGCTHCCAERLALRLQAEFIHRVFAIMGRAECHTFQILTKRSERRLDLDP